MRRCSAVALAGLAGTALRVFQLRVESDALPDGHAVVCSFSVPVDIMAQAEQCVPFWRGSRWLATDWRCHSLRRMLDAFRVKSQACDGGLWTAIQMYSIAQPSHAIVL